LAPRSLAADAASCCIGAICSKATVILCGSCFDVQVHGSHRSLRISPPPGSGKIRRVVTRRLRPNPNTTFPPATVSTGSLPSGFPEDFPLYEGATPVSGSESAIGIVASLETSDSYAEVLEFYRDALGRSPWEIVSEVPHPSLDASLFTISNKDDAWSGGTVSVSRAATLDNAHLHRPQGAAIARRLTASTVSVQDLCAGATYFARVFARVVRRQRRWRGARRRRAAHCSKSTVWADPRRSPPRPRR
jgi:hypothetical protein